MSDLEAVLEAASPGPWQLTQGPDGTDSAPWGLASADNYEVIWRGLWEPDARLAALAPALADEVLDRRRAGEALYEQLQQARRRGGFQGAGHSVLCPKFDERPGSCNCGHAALRGWAELEPQADTPAEEHETGEVGDGV